ncbi:hypothetical protein [Streptomyces sp. NBC_00649]|uniref:hypothetical protein n=1 Tax=Streptomyces sp. NBC_00649 TaxID=2975798 RepID=UPI00324DDEBC
MLVDENRGHPYVDTRPLADASAATVTGGPTVTIGLTHPRKERLNAGCEALHEATVPRQTDVPGGAVTAA